nr:TorF family putative porin [uncultured Sphingomonas sp.]
MSRPKSALQVGAAVSLLLLPAAAGAADQSGGEKPAPPLQWNITTGLLSDYRDRGLTYSDHLPAVQAGISVEHRAGFYAFGSGSTVRFGGNHDIEIAAGAGWTRTLGAVGEIDLSAAYVGYADFASSDYVEATAEWRLPLGGLTPFAAVDWAPSQKPLRGGGERFRSNLYLHGGAEWQVPETALALHGELGRERGSFVPGGGTKWDWQLGASLSVRQFDLGLSYGNSTSSRDVAGAQELGKRGLVLSASRAF